MIAAVAMLTGGPELRRPLSPAMAAALRDLAGGPLARTVAGWAPEGRHRWHSPGAVDGLIRRGLARAVERKKLGGVLIVTHSGLARARRLWPADFAAE